MTGIKRIGVVIILILSISGCAARSRTVKPTPVPEHTRAVMPEQVIPEMPSLMQQPVAKPLVGLPTGITYSQITNLISEFIDIEPLETTSGQPRFLGVSENGLVTLELIGDKSDILQASMKLTYPRDMEQIDADLNRAMLLRFLRNAVPGFLDWPSRVNDIVNKFHSMKAGTSEESIVFKRNVIDISYDKDLATIEATVSHK